MNNILTCEDIFAKNKFIPVVILDDIERAIPLAKSLLAGGISVMEITLRTQNAFKIIELIATEVPEMTVGAGTILTDDDYHWAIKHKAQFIVSPGLTSGLTQISREYDVPFLPGAITPTEVMQAVALGFKCVKFFPANGNGSYDTLKSLASPFPQIKFCPTGGITLENAKKFLDLPNVVGVGCSFLVNPLLIAANEFDKITAFAKQALSLL